MARDIESIERKIGSPNIPLPTVNGADKVISALQGFAGTAAKIGESIAVEDALLQGALAREEGKEVSLAPGINRPTQAFNKSYSDTDARIVAREGMNQISNVLNETLDPRNLNSNSSELFEAKVSGIYDGILESSLPQNRSTVSSILDTALSSARSQVQQEVIKFETKNLDNQFKLETTELSKFTIESALKGDVVAATEGRAIFNKALDDWEVIAPYKKFEIDELRIEHDKKLTQNLYVGDYLEARNAGRGDEWRNTFAQSTPEDLSIIDQLEVREQINKIDKQADYAEAGLQKEIISGIKLDINSERVSSVEELSNTPGVEKLTVAQFNDLGSFLINKRRAIQKTNNSLFSAEQKVKNSESQWMTGAEQNAYVQARVDAINNRNLEALQESADQTGTTLTQREIINSRASIEDQYGIALSSGRDLRMVNSTVSAAITNPNNIGLATRAAVVYAYDYTQNSGKHLKLDDKAESIMQTLIGWHRGGTEINDESVAQAQELVLRADKAEYIERGMEARKITKVQGLEMFKSSFGQESNATYNNGLYELWTSRFHDLFTLNGNAEATLNILNKEFSLWGQDNFTIPNQLVPHPVSKVLPGMHTSWGAINSISAQLDRINKDNNKSFTSANPIPLYSLEFEFDPNSTPTQEEAYSKPYWEEEKRRLFQESPVGKQIIVYPKEDPLEAEIGGFHGEERILYKFVPTEDALNYPQLGMKMQVYVGTEDGFYSPLPHTNQQLDPDLPETSDGNAYVYVKDLASMFPDFSSKLMDEQAVNIVHEADVEERMKDILDNPISKADFNLPIDIAKGQIPFTKKKSGGPLLKLISRYLTEKKSPEEAKKIIEAKRKSQLDADFKRLAKIVEGEENG